MLDIMLMSVLIMCFQGERATGYGVALLNTMFGHFSKDSTLQALSPFNSSLGDAAACKKQRRN